MNTHTKKETTLKTVPFLQSTSVKSYSILGFFDEKKLEGLYFAPFNAVHSFGRESPSAKHSVNVQ